MNNTKLYVALGLVAVAVAVGVIFLQSQDTQKVEVSLNNSSASVGSYDYVNPDHGFGLTLNSAWKGYKVFKTGQDSSNSYKICIPTTDTAATEAGVDSGYACPVSVFAISEQSWMAMEPLEHASFGDPDGVKAGTRLFVSNWQSPAPDLASVDFDLEGVKSSFRQ